jgi:hypothetical protein
MIDLKELKDNFNLEATFNLGEPKEFVGSLEGGKEILDRISLVLTQTFDAIGTLPFRQLVVKGKDKKVVIVYLRNNFFGIVAKKNENIDNILKYIYEKESTLKVKAKGKEKKEEKPVIIEEDKIFTTEIEEEEIVEREVKAKELETGKIAAKEWEKKEVKPVKVEAEKVEKERVEAGKVKEVSVQKAVLDPKVIDYIEEIAGNYLGDFSLDIVSNVIEDSGIDRKKPTKDQVLGISQSLKDAASLIIGPSKAKKLKEDILKKIEEVG